MKQPSSAGFSLLDLMITISIITILGGIGVANYQRFIRKAKDSEATVQLSTLFTAEKVYFQDYNGYTNNFFALIGNGLVGTYAFDCIGDLSGPIYAASDITIYPNFASSTATYCGNVCTIDPTKHGPGPQVPAGAIVNGPNPSFSFRCHVHNTQTTPHIYYGDNTGKIYLEQDAF